MPLSDLDREERLRLMRFVCSFAWADLEVQPEERTFVGRMIEKLDLQQERAQIEHWLRHPPAPEEVDPTEVPRQHRELFIEAIRGLVAADNVIDPNEREMLSLFEQLLT